MADLSVIIPCYNGERFIAETIHSVLAQGDPPRELFVIDDGSKDGSAGVVEKFVTPEGADAPCRVSLIRQANAGESRARNVGIARAASRYIALLDADDLWMPDKTARQIAALERNPAAVGVFSRVFNFTQTLDDKGREETERVMADPAVEDLIRYHYVAPSSLIVRRDALEGNNIRFDETTRHSEDMLFVADLRLAGPLVLVDEPLVAKRVHGSQQTKNPWHPILSAQSRVRWLRRNAARLDPAAVARLDKEFARLMVGCLEDRYWRRMFDGYQDARARVAELYHDALAASPVANRAIFPKWVYALRDRLSPPR